MKLYNLPRDTWFRLDGHRFFFDHLDGMYSFCKDEEGNIIHMAAWTEVEPEEKGDVK